MIITLIIYVGWPVKWVRLFQYIMKDTRRPIFVDAIGDIMEKKERATVLSVESQFRALFLVLFAPLFGFIADKYSIATLFLILGILCIIINRVIRIKPQQMKIN